MQKRQVLVNAIMTVGSILVNAATLFLLYRFLLRTLGPAQLGIWALVLATSSASQVLNLGLSSGIVIFVARYLAREDMEGVISVIQTAVISLVLIITPVFFLGYFLVKFLLGYVMPPDSLPAAIAILPYAILSLWLMSISSTYQSGLDGCQRMDLRNYNVMVSTVLYLLLCYFLAPRYGLKGVAYARVGQHVLLLGTSWALLRKCLPALPILPSTWSKSKFKEMVTYGLNFQIMAYSTMLFDPITKGLLSKFGDLSLVAYYEMASKLVQQFKSLVNSVNRVLVPAVADLTVKIPEKVKTIYLTSYQLLFYITLPPFFMIVIAAPVISTLWIGHYERAFVLYIFCLAVGGFFHTLATPAYMIYLGTGELLWNVLAQMAMAGLNVGLGFSLGILFGGTGVVLAWAISMSLGSSLIYLSYHIKNSIPLADLIPRANRPTLVVSLIGLGIFWLLNYNSSRWENAIKFDVISTIGFSIIMIILLWRHPMRQYLVNWIVGAFRPSPSYK